MDLQRGIVNTALSPNVYEPQFTVVHIGNLYFYPSLVQHLNQMLDGSVESINRVLRLVNIENLVHVVKLVVLCLSHQHRDGFLCFEKRDVLALCQRSLPERSPHACAIAD